MVVACSLVVAEEPMIDESVLEGVGLLIAFEVVHLLCSFVVSEPLVALDPSVQEDNFV